MTKEEFEVLQLDLQLSGKSVKDYLHDVGVNYSTYNYWRKKMMDKIGGNQLVSIFFCRKIWEKSQKGVYLQRKNLKKV